MINKKFSVLRAYYTAITMLLEYISFYVVWYAIVIAGWFCIAIAFGLYADLLDYNAITSNWSWIGAIMTRWLAEIKISYNSIPSDISVYGMLSHFLPSNILNHTLETMSWSEYFNIIIGPKKIVLLVVAVAVAWLSMSVSIGFIKTALSFQSKGTACFHDLYQYFYLVPAYVATKVVMLVACGLPIALLVLTRVVFGTWQYFVALIVGAVVVFIYQRLRFAKYFVIDQGMNPSDACVASWHVTKGSVMHLLIFSICSMVFMAHHLSGVLMYFVVTLDKQAEVSVYRQLIGEE